MQCLPQTHCCFLSRVSCIVRERTLRTTTWILVCSVEMAPVSVLFRVRRVDELMDLGVAVMAVLRDGFRSLPRRGSVQETMPRVLGRLTSPKQRSAEKNNSRSTSCAP